MFTAPQSNRPTLSQCSHLRYVGNMSVVKMGN